MAKKVLCSSHVPWIPDRPSSGSLVMLTAIGCASSKVNCLASTASRRRDLRRTRGDQRVHCASMLKVDASDLALTREALYRTLSLERAASGHAAALPSAASNSRRPMVTVIRPSRARCVKATIPRHARAVFTLGEQDAGRFHRYSRRQLFANAGHDGLANLQRSPTRREYQPIAVPVSRLGFAVAACATELPYLSPDPHQTRCNVD